MEISIINNDISKSSTELLFKNKTKKSLNDNYDNNENNSNENNPVSLKLQHFENFTKKLINNKNNSKVDNFQNEINIRNKLYNNNVFQNKNYMTNFPMIKSFTNFQNNNITRNKYNYLNTYSFNSNKNIINEKKSLKIIPNLNKIQNKNKNNEKKIKLKAKTPNQTFLNKNKINKNINKDKSRNNEKSLLIKYHSQNSEGYLTRKEINGVPLTFEPIMIYNNLYSNKSEKKRHEIILDEFIKLRQYIERQPEKKLLFIKEFLKKYYIEYEKFDENQLLSLCDFICYYDKNTISSILKPYLDIKTMIIELINNINKINNLLGIKDNIKNNEIKEEVKEEIISEEAKINDSKIGDKCNIYLSPNIIENNNNISNENNKIKFYEKENLRRQKYNNRYDNNLSNDEEAIKEIKRKLRDLEHQKKLHIPDKNYSFRNDLIIKDINREMKILKNNFEQTLYNKQLPIRKYNSQNKYNNDNNTNNKIKHSIIFSQFKKRPKNVLKLEEDIMNELNKINKSNSSGFMLMKKENIIKTNDNNKTNIINKYSMDEIIKRLYYKPMRIKFDLNEVRKNNKITEYYALKLAKYNKFLYDINNNSYFLKNKNTENNENLNYI